MPNTRPKRRTRRQALGDLLAQRQWTFDELRVTLAIPIHLLEDDLRHLDRSLRRGRRRLAVTPALCRDCGFRFSKRAPKRFHEPGRCPRCRGERVAPAKLEVRDE
jgi:predicted Zn-ribbon and HTH transcriptional regulator